MGNGQLVIHESWLPNEHGLYRPRHSRRQRAALLAAAVFFLTPLVLFVSGMRAPEIENRPLADFPSPAAGWEFVTGFDQWATDHLVFRHLAVNAADGISRGLFREPPPLGQVQARPGADAGPVVPPVTGPEDRERVNRSRFPTVLEGHNGWLYLGYDVLGACHPERPADEVLVALQKLRAGVEASGRQFVLVVPPNKTTMVPQHLPGSAPGTVCAREAGEEFWNVTVPAVAAIDVRPALREVARRQGRPVYSPWDSHWNHEGALVLSRAITEAIQPGLTRTWDVRLGSVAEYSADLPPLLGREATFPMQTYDVAPNGWTVRSGFSGPVSRAEPVRIFQDPVTGMLDATVGMVGDSFGLAAVPYLAAGFADLTIAHADLVGRDPGKVAALFAESDVVVLQAVERSLVGGEHPLLKTENLDSFLDALTKNSR